LRNVYPCRYISPMNKRIFLTAAMAAWAGGLVACAPAEAALPSVTVDEARAATAAGKAVLIDIREPDEHARGVAAGAKLLPMSQMGGRLSEIPSDPGTPVLLICNTQNRSTAALKQLRARPGYEHLRFVEGGMSEWVRRGLPVIPPSR
jgi:rhodanese-related sulfurtransferase